MFFQDSYSIILTVFAVIEEIFGERELMAAEAQDLQKVQHKNVPYVELTLLPKSTATTGLNVTICVFKIYLPFLFVFLKKEN